MNILVFIFAFLIFNLVVVSHEFGHFFTAGMFGIKVEEFAVGMGPRVLSRKKNETVYSIRSFPIGGFCALEGEDSTLQNESLNETSFAHKPVWQKTIVLLAGGFMNVVLGFIFAFILSCTRGVPSTVISNFDQNSISSSMGLKIGDEILSINGRKTFVGRDVLFALRTDSSEFFTVKVMRDDISLTIKDVKFERLQDSKGQYYSNMDFHVSLVDKSFLNLINYSVLDIYSVIRVSVFTIGGLIKGKFSLKDMSGPIGIATQINDITKEGLQMGFGATILEILSFMAMFSVSIGIFNLIPFPALDGGRVAFLLIEKICGKKFKPGVEAIFHTVGFYLLIFLMIAISYNDILRIIKSFGGN